MEEKQDLRQPKEKKEDLFTRLSIPKKRDDSNEFKIPRAVVFKTERKSLPIYIPKL